MAAPLPGSARLSGERKKGLSEFQKAAGLRFKSLDLLNRAFTHRSFYSEGSSGHANNERLEFLGDSVLGLSAADWLYTHLPDKAEGDLARIKSYVVSEECLSEIAFGLGIDRYLVMGKGEEHSGGRMKKAIMADALEAVIGAYYLDADFAHAKKFVQRMIVPEIENVLAKRHKRDFKTLIQEYAQKNSKAYPRYLLTKRSGPDHDRTFWVSVSVCGKDYPEASGKSKKEAEQNAAKLAYESIIASGGQEADKLRAVEQS
jgi:ribonuclease III